MEHNAARDTFMLWLTKPDIYDLELIDALVTYPFTDSTGTLISRTDTVSFRYRKPAPPRGGTGRVPDSVSPQMLPARSGPEQYPSSGPPLPLLNRIHP